MRIAVVLAPVADWQSIVAAARTADELGFDAVGLWDHYQSGKPEWAYIAGWSAMAALAASTSRVRLVQMVVNSLHFEPGVVAKETSTLAIISGRYELGIGAGDWPESFGAWGRPFPERDERIARLAETVEIVRYAWKGEQFDYDGRFSVLHDACVTPAPAEPPRVVVGVGKSLRLAESAVSYADELNVYADDQFVKRVQQLVASSGRDISVSLFLSWEWDKWPDDPAAELERWRSLGIERVFVSLGSDDMTTRLKELAPLISA